MRIVLRLFLNVSRFILGLLPMSWRKFLRRQHRMMELYSRALLASRMFFGEPSPQKEANRYKKLLLAQSKSLTKISEKERSTSINVVIFVGEHVAMLNALIDELNAMQVVSSIYIFAAKEKILEDAFFSQGKVISSMNALSYDLPVLLLRSQDRVYEHEVKAFVALGVESYGRAQMPTIISCDTDILDKDNIPSTPRCMPQWNPDLQLSTGYLNTGLIVFGQSLVEDLTDFVRTYHGDSAYALWLCKLYLENAPFQLEHLSLSLVHSKQHKSNWIVDIGDYVATLSSPKVSITQTAEESTCAVVKWGGTSSPLVSIIIPTFNAKDLVKTCIESVLKKSTYQNYEILLVDNNSDDIEALDYFNYLSQNEDKVRLLSYPKPFNYSAINNFASTYAKGEVLAFLNNDVEVITPEWLSFMVSHVMRRDIGCVGAKLLYPNNRVQHAGVVLGYGGGAGHAHKFYPSYHSGYMSRLLCTNNYSAVTAACMLVKREDFNAVGGFDEENLKVAFNDVDLCLNVVMTGKRNLYCAEAVLYHHESVSRGSENTPEKRQRFEDEVYYMQSKWAEFIDSDPCYSPNLTKRHENFALKD